MIAEFLDEAFETHDSADTTKAIGIVARAKGMTAVSRARRSYRERACIVLQWGTLKPEFGYHHHPLDALGVSKILPAKAKAALNPLEHLAAAKL